MDARVAQRLIERAIVSLGLDRPLHPWWLGEQRPPRAVRWVRVLASPCPLPYELEPALLLAAFPATERTRIARQLDDAYGALMVLPRRPHEEEREEAGDPTAFVQVQLGLPLVARSRALIRVRTHNIYADAQAVTGDFHAWLTPSGDESDATGPAQKRLAAAWPRWVVGRSPGLV